MTNYTDDIVIQALKEKRDRLYAEIKKIDSFLQSNNPQSDNTIATIDKSIKSVRKESSYRNDYSKGWSLPKKFVYLLRYHNRFLHFREAAAMINELESTGLTDSELTSKLSSGTFGLKKDGVIVKYQYDKNNKNSFWGRKEWLNSNDKIISGHEFNEEYVYKKIKTGSELFDSFE